MYEKNMLFVYVYIYMHMIIVVSMSGVARPVGGRGRYNAHNKKEVGGKSVVNLCT
jgi:hypothetical protein